MLSAQSIKHLGEDFYDVGPEFDSADGLDMHNLVRSFLQLHDSEDPFYIVNLGDVERQYQKFKAYLPRVTPFYAVKCNPNPKMIKLLWQLGAKFDVASRQEMVLVKNALQGENIGTTPDELKRFHETDMIFANPCKQVSHIQYAKTVGVKKLVVDSVSEIIKTHKHYPDAQLVIRIKVDDSQSLCKFSSKFGADLELCPELLRVASELGCDVIGVSFHVGSGCQDASSFVGALERAKTVFDMAKGFGYTFSFLDIGGGFNGDSYSKPTFEEVGDACRDVLDELFDESVTVIAEPGRYFAKTSHTLVCNVIAKKEHPHATGESSRYHLYINDGVYGSFNCTLFDHYVISCERDVGLIRDADVSSSSRLIPNTLDEEELFPTTLFGPTCDSMDKICEQEFMPNCEVGDVMYFKQFGAYTVSASTAFNGFLTQQFFYIRK